MNWTRLLMAFGYVILGILGVVCCIGFMGGFIIGTIELTMYLADTGNSYIVAVAFGIILLIILTISVYKELGE